ISDCCRRHEWRPTGAFPIAVVAMNGDPQVLSMWVGIDADLCRSESCRRHEWRPTGVLRS
ncbi:MAG: hypothetical protein KBG29_05675, partial [Pseudomonadales bacterium]|nr:hypothetical protein [Pseudomonadales bacterium]